MGCGGGRVDDDAMWEGGDGGEGTNRQLSPLGIEDSRLRSSLLVRAWQYGAQPLLWWKLG